MAERAPSPGLVTRVVLVDDHAVVRRGLRQLFEREPDFAVAGEAATEADAFDAVERLHPDLLVTDLTLEGRGGLDLIRRVRRYHPDLPIVVVSMHDPQLYGPRVLAAGAQGYVTKSRADGDVIQVARAVRAGGVCIAEAAGAPAADPTATLTDREFEVFRLVGEGFTPRHIAEALSLSVSTVEVYRERIKAKLGIESSPLLLRYAVRWCKDHGET